ncbi:hypothetical protein [Streptomyces sp. ODS05-4]|uniref:hypothetical protein n=1 Tax=Streptomyces sp. ODS05-4 TaxID=2944939 RepID=UPI00210AB8E2|nr:hypothetical protein [Streptomyces sp. ODS05-4]
MSAGLLEAHHRQYAPAALEADVVRGAVAGRTFEAHPTPVASGGVVWWLVDDTDLRLAEQPLASERERTELLAEISAALLSSLNVQRCMEVTARMAADHLADAAMIVAPGGATN